MSNKVQKKSSASSKNNANKKVSKQQETESLNRKKSSGSSNAKGNNLNSSKVAGSGSEKGNGEKGKKSGGLNAKNGGAVSGQKNTQESKKTFSKLSPQNSTKLQKLKDPIAGAFEDKNPSRKTQGLVNKLYQNNIKKLQKQNATSQNKSRNNLQDLKGDKASKESSHVEGIVKKVDLEMKKPNKNNSSDIKANVIGKKPDIKVIGNKWLIIASIVLAVFLSASVISNFVFYGVFKHKAETPMFTVTKSLELNLENNASVVASITVPRNILPDTKLPQTIDVNGDNFTASQVFRFKVMFTTADLVNSLLEIEEGEHLTLAEDGYFYYNLPLLIGEKSTICNAIMLPKEIRLGINNVTLNVVTVVCETLNTSQTLVKSVWTTAPTEWLDVVFPS